MSLNFSGESEDTRESLSSLAQAFILALILIYFLLILTFQSFVWPMIIILAIPIGAVSVVLALFIHGEPLSFMGLLGVVALAGVIVNNAIVFVDFVMKERKRGMDQNRSIREAGKKTSKTHCFNHSDNRLWNFANSLWNRRLGSFHCSSRHGAWLGNADWFHYFQFVFARLYRHF